MVKIGKIKYSEPVNYLPKELREKVFGKETTKNEKGKSTKRKKGVAKKK